MQHYTRLTALALGIATTPLAWATGTADNQETVTVTASGYTQQVVNAPASTSVITREELEKRNYRDVTDALDQVPGVIVTGGGGGDRGEDISMRGMPSDYTLILVDGRRQSTRETRPNGSAGFEQDWLPPLQSIERIEVIRGPMSTLYGSDAIGGVINIITRKVADDWHGNVRVDTTLQEDDDSGDSQQSQVYVSGPLHEGLLGLQLYGEYQTRQEDNITYGYEDKRLGSATARFSLTPTDNHDFTFEAGREEQNRAARVGNSVPVDGCRGGCSDSHDEYNREHYAVTHAGRFGFGTTDSYVQREISDNRTRDIEITNTVADSRIVLPFSSHMLSLGINYQKEKLEDGSTNQISDRTEIENHQWALFAEDEWFMTDSFSLTAGVRLDDNENYGSHVSPRLYGVWNLAPRWTLKGGVSSGYRSPSLREITPDWGQVSRGGNIYGNPDLEPETSINKELGLYYNVPNGLLASLTLFHNDFEDKITRVTCPTDVCTDGANQFGSDPTWRINVDEAVTRGVEASLEAPLTERLQLTASYTFTDSEQKSGDYEGQPLTQLPRHLFSTRLDWDPTDRLSAWSRVTYRGKESEPVSSPSSQTLRAPSYTLVDSGGSWQISQRTDFLFGVYNLFDREIDYDTYGQVQDGRRYWVGIDMSF
ncbi:outer membrane receptor for ferrienterochelin and colicins [Kushneria sinocarnis]|uniref:Outer membrane receptor for ferrienterochelin and colicins n=1 Tax=Kushneria sinocarnis TaxID=595502 RepID=A0A420X0P2_9GAMM|nr:ligand-gated channel protein [Kushneria sinocarnis]RKR07320.1 outer membrane receptor for ferrienterochelin and colicins [Kushneria sinocarnis]